MLFYLRITLGGIKLRYSLGRLPLYCLSQRVLYDNSNKGCFAILFKSPNQVDSLFPCVRTACGSYSLIRWLRKVTCCDDLEIFLSIILWILGDDREENQEALGCAAESCWM